jgi:SAM-dependent methyltransferase
MRRPHRHLPTRGTWRPSTLYRDQRPVAAGATSASTPEAWARNFAAATTLHPRKRRRMIAGLETRLIRRYLAPGASILDAGCGLGEWVVLLNELGYVASGCDYSPELIRRLREAYPNHHWVQADIRSLPQESGSMNGVISWGVIEHDEAGPGAALREFHRILRPDGVAIVTVPFDTRAARRAGQVLDHAPGSAHAFFQYLMTPEELCEHGRQAGFDVIESGTLPYVHVALVAPRLSLRLRGLALRVANVAVQLLFSRLQRYRVMTYAVLRKRAG